MGTVVHIHRKGGQEPPRQPTHKGGKSPSLQPTDEERRHIAAALRGLRTRFGTWERVAETMGVTASTVQAATDPNYHTSYAVAVLAARAAKVPVEAILTGTLTDAGRCPSCGSTLTQRAAGGAR